MKNNSRILGDIADIRTGIFARPQPSGDLAYLQAKHFNELGQLISKVQPDLRTALVDANHRLVAGDVLFAAKGSKNFSALYEGNFPAAASTTFFVSRLRTPEILPEYLVWYLNEPTTLEFLKREAVGSSIVSIPKSSLAKLEIPIPPIDVQRKILQTEKLSRLEHELRLKIADLRQGQVRRQIAIAIK